MAGRDPTWITCPKCHGSREVYRKCPQCNGKGTIGTDRFGNDVPCGLCGTVGEVADACGTCGGVGEVPV